MCGGAPPECLLSSTASWTLPISTCWPTAWPAAPGLLLGKIKLGSHTIDENYIPYNWELIFNSQQINGLKIPELPEEIKSWEFYEAFSTQPLQVDQVEIKKAKLAIEAAIMVHDLYP